METLSRGGKEGLSDLRFSLWGILGEVPIVFDPRSWCPALVAQIRLQGLNPFVFMVTGADLERSFLGFFVLVVMVVVGRETSERSKKLLF